jgi:hypothetical protein
MSVAHGAGKEMTMKTPALLIFAFATMTLAACDPQGGGDGLVGSWTRMREGTTEVRDQFAFRADGTMTFDENKPDARADEDHVTGTYTVSDGAVVATMTNTKAAGQVRVTFTYYANDTLFSPNALRAPAGHDGIVGVWTGATKMEDLDDPSQPVVGGVLTGEFHADGSLRWSTTPPDGSAVRVHEGTWAAESADTFRTAASGVSDSVVTLVDGQALIPDDYVWQRD